MIQQPVIPRVPLALQASGGVVIDPATGVVTINPAALPSSIAAGLLQSAAAGLPTIDPAVVGTVWNNGGILAISKGP